MICTHNNKHTYTVRTHKKTEGFTLPHATAVIVDKFSFFFHVLVEDWFYPISTFYRIKIGQEFMKLWQVREIKLYYVVCVSSSPCRSSSLSYNVVEDSFFPAINNFFHRRHEHNIRTQHNAHTHTHTLVCACVCVCVVCVGVCV